ncbi:MAG: FAD-dependent oxidoreductase [Bacteroidales bacterium]|nr:FAD-dependent oxidoreductase [Bacteroidales bacterium]
MRRRDFLSKLTVAAGSIGLGIGCTRRVYKHSGDTLQKSNTDARNGRKYVIEPSRKIEVLAETDVLVIGGGPAGTAAAIASSRTGAETCLVERYNHLGGLWTGGLVLPLLSTHAVDRDKRRKQVIFGVWGEMAERLKNLGMSIQEINPVIDPEAGKYVLDEMVREAGVKTLFHAWCTGVIMDENVIKGVYIESKSGRHTILAKVVIDSTGDGDVLHLAGENYEMMNYHIGLNYRLGNADRVDRSRPLPEGSGIGSPTPLKSVNWVNMHGPDDQNGVDILNLSRLQMEFRKEIWEKTWQLRHTPGYEEIFLLDTASQIGVRMSRILDGEYKLTLEDTMTYRSFDDVIGVSGAWTTIIYNGQPVKPEVRPMWQIPFRSLIPRKTDNLLVAGRCFCFEKALVEDTRIIGTCLVTGHGAGAAAALAVKKGMRVRDVNPLELKKLLIQQGAWLG